jgi:hypothetical protein
MSQVDISELRERAIDVCIDITWRLSTLADIRALPENLQTETMRGFISDANQDRIYLASLENHKLAEEYQKRIAYQAIKDKELERLDVAERHDAELRSQGDAWVRNQINAGFARHHEDQEKHEQWRSWQAAEIFSNPNFARQSKQEQAKRLKEKHSIPDEVGTIAKRLEPLPSGKKI